MRNVWAKFLHLGATKAKRTKDISMNTFIALAVKQSLVVYAAAVDDGNPECHC